MKKIILSVILFLSLSIFSSCLKNKEYCWMCDGFEDGHVFTEKICGYTEDGINILMNDETDNKDFLSCHKY